VFRFCFFELISSDLFSSLTDKVWLIQLARFATVTAAVLTEYGVLAVTLPQVRDNKYC
jgi:hypothetical protein